MLKITASLYQSTYQDFRFIHHNKLLQQTKHNCQGAQTPQSLLIRHKWEEKQQMEVFDSGRDSLRRNQSSIVSYKMDGLHSVEVIAPANWPNFPSIERHHIPDDHALLASAVQQQLIHYKRLEHLYTRQTG